jgi:hypothetical protein
MIRKRLVLAALGLALGATAARAQTELKDVATGAVYTLTANADGTATLAGTDAMEVYTIKPSPCVAEHPIFGLVMWKIAEGGWKIELDGTVFLSFADTPPPLDAPCGE